jgi:hypothetical protein
MLRPVPFFGSYQSVRSIYLKVAKQLNVDVSEVKMVASGKRVSARIWLAIQEEIAHSATAALRRRAALFGAVAWAAMLFE